MLTSYIYQKELEKRKSHIRGIGKENANGTKILTFCIYQKKLIKGNGKKGKSHQRDWKGKGKGGWNKDVNFVYLLN